MRFQLYIYIYIYIYIYRYIVWYLLSYKHFKMNILTPNGIPLGSKGLSQIEYILKINKYSNINIHIILY